MEFDFNEDQKMLRDTARKFLEAECAPTAVRAVLDDDGAHFDKALYQKIVEMGFTGAAVPEEFGGLGLGHLELCVIAEELGRALAPVPFSSSIFLAAEALMLAGTDAQKANWLPKLVSGEVIGTLAMGEGNGAPSARNTDASFDNGVVSGKKAAVPDGAIANLIVTLVRTGKGDGAQALSLALVDASSGVSVHDLKTVDPSRKMADLTFDGASAELLGGEGEGLALLEQLLNRAAVLTAFEQLGGANRALEMAVGYAKERYAFGRQIGSYQAIKHMLADMYVSQELARSNAYYGAWALSTDAPELALAAATARVAGTQAFQHCSKNNIQTHGGMGFTWEVDAHLFYRRSNHLALTLGSLRQWKDKLATALEKQNQAA